MTGSIERLIVFVLFKAATKEKDLLQTLQVIVNILGLLQQIFLWE